MYKLFLFLIFLPLVGCQKSVAPSQTPKKLKSVQKTAEKSTQSKENDVIKQPGDTEEEAYRLSFKLPQKVSIDQPFLFHLIAHSKGIYHINKEFPISLKIKKGGKVLGKDRFKKEDVKLLSDDQIEFDLKGTCTQKGVHTLDGEFTFGYCTDTLCGTAKQKFTFDVTVE